VDDVLAVWRGLHFVTTIEVAGLIIFSCFVLRDFSYLREGGTLRYLFWLSYILAVISGIGWLMEVAANADGSTAREAFSDGTAAAILFDTQFGKAWIWRASAVALLGALIFLSKCDERGLLVLLLLTTLIYVGGIAFSGHAASSPGAAGSVHLVADVLHLLAVSAWLGGLLPYLILLANARTQGLHVSSEEIKRVTLQFSSVGITAVLTILITGVINSLFLVGSFDRLVTSDHGRLLALKVLLFLVMVAIAAVNRLILTPRLDGPRTLYYLRRNTLLELVFGLCAVSIAAVLGLLPPALSSMQMP